MNFWRLCSITCLMGVVFPLFDLSAQGLPQLTKEERESLKNGTVLPGADLLTEDDDFRINPSDIPRAPAEPEVEPVEPAEPEPVYDPKVVAEEYISDYFKTAPNHYLIDPQRLLSKQESIDREGFLDYHAEDSGIVIRMYLFDAQQEIPEGYQIEKVAKRHFSNGPLTAVTYCFLGDPSRTQLFFAGEDSEHISDRDIRNALESAMVKAMEKSDPADQLESYIIQLSIRLFWLEKAILKAKPQPKVTVSGAATTEQKKATSAAAPSGVWASIQPYALYIAVGASGIIIAGLALLMGIILLRRSRSYQFPVLEIPQRLGAEYGAGVGAVVGFKSQLGSPASQLEKMPDYMNRW